MQTPEVFVIAPTTRELQPVLEAVQRAAVEAGFTIARFDQHPPGAMVTSRILDRIRQADLIIADVSRQNSNVMYELGFAHALRKPTILLLNIKSGDSKLPADLAGFAYFPYDPADLGRLALRLGLEMKAVTMQRSA
ncbi:MAG: nucleoside 2-deoxyribosyltransferase [Bryobacteraceae bacterium]